jgi:hypothetical protein
MRMMGVGVGEEEEEGDDCRVEISLLKMENMMLGEGSRRIVPYGGLGTAVAGRCSPLRPSTKCRRDVWWSLSRSRPWGLLERFLLYFYDVSLTIFCEIENWKEREND